MRNTLQKKIIKDALMTADHPTATGLCAIVQKDHPTVSRGTVFRVLSQFSESGEITRIFADGEARFDACTKPHAHFKCLKCGRLYDVFDGCVSDALSLKNASGMKILSASVNYLGICGECGGE